MYEIFSLILFSFFSDFCFPYMSALLCFVHTLRGVLRICPYYLCVVMGYPDYSILFASCNRGQIINLFTELDMP